MRSPTLTRALAAKREARYQQEILEGLGRDPSFARDVAYDAFCDAIATYRHIIQTEWDARRMERYLPHVGLTQSEVVGAVELRAVAA